MIRMVYRTIDGRKVVFLGIDKENVRRLQEDQPIKVEGPSLDLDHDIVIVYGETLDKIVKEYDLPVMQ